MNQRAFPWKSVYLLAFVIGAMTSHVDASSETIVPASQPIDALTAVSMYQVGGVTMTADDLLRIVDSDAIARGPGGGAVLVVECSGAFGYDTIQSAIDAAIDGDVVLVLPNDCSSDNRWHERIDFTGKAITVQSANPTIPAIVDATIIDGDAAGTVVVFQNSETNDSVLDGLTITNGIGSTSARGGGIRIQMSSPTIRRCTLRNNWASIGGAIYVDSFDTAIVESCRITETTVPGHVGGYAVYANRTTPRFTDCDFTANPSLVANLFPLGSLPCESSECGGFFGCRFEENEWDLIRSTGHVTIRDSVFARNPQKCVDTFGLTMTDCRFEDNGPQARGLIYTARPSTIERTVFTNNEVDFSGVVVLGNATTLQDCQFDSNRSRIGAIIAANSGAARLEDCDFSSNDTRTGAINGFTSSVFACRFTGNTATIGAGAINATTVTGLISNSIFTRNTSQSSGGAIFIAGGAIRDCLFAGNRAADQGGAIQGNATIVDGCTIVGNYAEQTAGGAAGARVSNSIIMLNRDNGDDPFHAQILPHLLPMYSNIQDFPSYFPGSGQTPASLHVLSVDPKFVDPGHWDDMDTPSDPSDDEFVIGDYHLLPDSPCIDAADPAFDESSSKGDIDGETRVQSCRIDMGADEFTQSDVLPGDFDGDGNVTIDDVPGFVAETLMPAGLGVCAADVNGDGIVNGNDVSAFLAMLIGAKLRSLRRAPPPTSSHRSKHPP
ncbi:MAG: hypothetical protein H6819_05310 [Phycisphaerales bacterium]|nr:hypothetical protein [Phycisphaerales bacterium]MCB9854803.1 hypothetical protein [Phycisphaerales bacterium]MCB9863725.1 hypothetical protein [Phycisphaerales bacterium]